MSEQVQNLELQFMRGEMSAAVNTIIETINVLQHIQSLDKSKVRRTIRNLIRVAMIIYADEKDFIQMQIQRDQLQAMFAGEQEEETIQ